MTTHRNPSYPIHPMILNRWSPRSMSGEEMSDAEILPLFEAARWAPSSYNNQPWRFLYVKRGNDSWNTLFNLLIPFNQSWCKNAALLCLIYSKNRFDKTGKPCITHSFDTGAAWENLCLEGTSRGYVVHGMQGFNYEEAQKLIPEEHTPEAMFAIGKKGLKENLPDDLQKMESPSTRRPLSEIISELK